MNTIETEVMKYLLAGEHPDLAILRAQMAEAKVTDREYVDGFFTEFEVDEGVPKPSRENYSISDVYAEFRGLEFGAGFILFVRSGVIAMLECYPFDSDEGWPEDAELRRVYYAYKNRTGALIETIDRDLDSALKY